MIMEQFTAIGEYAAAGLYENTDRGLFYRKALGLRRFYENSELAEYRGKPLYPSGVIAQKMAVVPDYTLGLSFKSGALASRAPELSKRLIDEFCIFRSTVPSEHTVAGNMFTHSMPNYERILSDGLLSYLDRIESITDTDMRDGLTHLVKGIETYVNRCIEYLISVSADPKLVNALKQVPLYPARDAYEALVGWNFILYLDNCDNIGCLAKGILPYYRGEDLVSVIENLYDNLDENGGYSMSLTSDCPALTVQCLKAARGRRRPMIELLVDESTPDEIWDAALEIIKSGSGGPAFYNKRALLDGLKKRFPTIKDADLERFCGGGCTEAMLSGLSNVGSLDAGINLLLILEKTIKSELPLATDFDGFLETYLSEVESVTERVMASISESRILRAEHDPVPMRTLLVDDCIDRGVEFNHGGARYNWSIINFAGMINVIDSLLAIKQLVFEEKKYTPCELISRLSQNDGELREEVIKLPISFGKDNDEANRFSREISTRIFSMTDRGKVAFGEGFLSSSIQFRAQADAGRRIGATPDGRCAGAPLCDSLAAIYGKDIFGPTALINSITSLGLEHALGVPVVNFNLTESFDNSVLKALVKSYIMQGGIQLQMTCASREELMDAFEHPELHRNLIVRVGGYSEYFNRLTDDLKRMIIKRTVQDGSL